MMPDHSFQMQFMFDPFQLGQRASAVERFYYPAGHGEPPGISLAIGGDNIVGTHRVLDAVRLEITRRRHDCRHGHAVRLHSPDTVRIISVLPTFSFLQASADE